MTPQALDLLTAPLSGITLVEASAGTGKTYSIAWLYLRFLLERGLPPSQILVVTFTEAAADELRARIRARLVWLRAALLADSGVVQAESASAVERELIAGILSNCARLGRDGDTIAALLDLAIVDFDTAAIHTIHAFCRRVLAEFALDSGVPLQLAEPGNDVALRLRLVEDFWRREVHAGDPLRAAWLLRSFDSPGELAYALRELLALPAQARQPRDSAAALAEALQAQRAAFQHSQALWQEQAERQVLAVFADKAHGFSCSKTNRTDKISLAATLEALGGYLQAGDHAAMLPSDAEIFQRDALRQVQTPKARESQLPLPDHALFAALHTLAEAALAVARLQRAALLATACDYVDAQTRQHQETTGTLGFDGLIGRLHEALEAAGGELLAQRLRQRYPVALVDEFQDTDQRQYAIFQRICGGHTALLMIGDAKQSIYGFRGGDVYAWATARNDAAAQVFTLDTNYRAEPALTHALNTLFGAPQTFVADFIGWRDVRAGGPKQGRWLRPAATALTIWHAPPDAALRARGSKQALVAATRLEPHLAIAVAGEIVWLLDAANRGEMTLDSTAGAVPRALDAGDIAVLVVSHQQASLVETALRAVGVAVSRRARDNVFASVEAGELVLLLRALLEPSRLARVRAALATLLFGRDAAQLLALDGDPEAWEALLADFSALASRWFEQGVLSLVHEVLRLAVPRLLPLGDGERRIANYLQLADLLDAASAECSGPAGLLAWLQQNRHNPDRDRQEQLLRLDRDSAAVQVVTIHASKGLEYPVVFAPYLWKGKKPGARDQAPVICHDAHYRVIADLGTPRLAQHAADAAAEDYAESIRLAYVACTRAINRLYLAWGSSAGGSHAPLLRLLDPAAAAQRQAVPNPDDSAVLARLQALAQASAGTIAVLPLPLSDGAPLQPAMTAAALQARDFTRTLFDPRRSLSFTRLLQGNVLAPVADHDRAVSVVPETDGPDADTAVLRGAAFGECLHQILEHADFNDDTPAALNAVVLEQVRRAGFASSTVPQFFALARLTLQAPLIPGLRLRDLAPAARVAEMEFHFRLGGGTPPQLARLQRLHPRYADALQFLASPGPALYGLMNGFIDLTLQHAGRFYVLDYKSNWLGRTPADYTPQALDGAMREHRYDLQALIYQVALQRYLRLRLGRLYDGALLGGALYVFVRGLALGAVGAGVVQQQPDAELIDALDAWFDGR